MSVEMIRALSELIGALIWPAIVIIVLFVYRNSMKNILANLEEISLPGGFAAKIRRDTKRAADRAIRTKEPSEGPTAFELETAEKIGLAALDYDLSVVRQQLQRFAVEYERIRATLSGGSERTRLMQGVVAKMRTLALAARPLLSEFSESRSAGDRLAAVVILQVSPDSEWISWLGDQGSEDMTFVGHQASVALLMAARSLRDAPSRALIEETAGRITGALEKEPRKHHRERVLRQVERELERAD